MLGSLFPARAARIRIKSVDWTIKKINDLHARAGEFYVLFRRAGTQLSCSRVA